MSETKSPHGGLTRRSFLKTTGAVAAATAAVGSGATLVGLAAAGEAARGRGRIC
ncbi:MAG: twin-arginine translocation signal domain-containing protein [Gordonibacter pamelaeae]